MTGPLS